MFSIQLVGRLVNENDSVAKICEESPPPGWVEVFIKAKGEIELVSKILSQIGLFFPYKKDLFRAFDLCPLNEVKVVIIGQDPYHSTHAGNPQANGMSFSTNKGCPIQPSLLNIYKELEREYSDFKIPDHGDLSRWAEQGVLMLNACLTVAPHQAGSHKGIWNGFITRVLDAISEANPECIFLLWGAPAQKLAVKLNQRSIKLYASHPSPLSAYKDTKDAPAFMGCGHFKITNDFLIKQGKTPIDWRLD